MKKMLYTISAVILAGTFGSNALAETKQISLEQYQQHYQYQKQEPEMVLTQLDKYNTEFTFTSFDGEKIKGQIRYPMVNKAQHPVLLGLHAMGRSYPRWFNADINGRPTITQSHKITEQALAKGYAVIAIDARHHGLRKQETKPLQQIMKDVHAGKTEDYENMIRETIMDYQVLLDWLEQQPQFTGQEIRAAGYSMGGQMAVLLSALDPRVGDVLSIVPPHIDSEMAHIAPATAATFIDDSDILLLSANKDQYSTEVQNVALFDHFKTNNKVRIVFDAGHILPESYVNKIGYWF